MPSLFEKDNTLNEPVECFLFDASREKFPVRPHWHYFAEFIYMVSGEAEMTSGSRSFPVHPGDLILFAPSAVHAIFPAGDTLPVYSVLKFDLSRFPSISSYSPSPAAIFRYAAEKGFPFYYPKQDADALGCKELFSDCIQEIRDYRYGYDVMLRAQLYRLIYRIIRSWTDIGLNVSECAVSAENDEDIEHITEYIDSHLNENILVRELAAICHMSYSAFAVRFRSRYGMSCKEYIERMRIFKAEEYLLLTDYDLGYISSQTGFSDCSHFIKSFRQQRGITPKQYRMKKRRG